MNLKTFGAFIGVCLLGYCSYSYIEEQNEIKRQEEIAAAEQREVERKDKAALSAVMDKIKAGDRKIVEEIYRNCKLSAYNDQTYYIDTDTRDPDKVKALLDHLHPYDTDSMLRYLDLPEKDEAQFQEDIARQMQSEWDANETASFKFAVKYARDTILGMRSGWAILTCTMKGSEVGNAELYGLYEQDGAGQ